MANKPGPWTFPFLEKFLMMRRVMWDSQALAEDLVVELPVLGEFKDKSDSLTRN